MDFETVRYEAEGQIATITLNRPEAANAENTQMIEDIDAAFDSAESDEEVRVVILAAEGRHFSSGHDLKEILRGEEHWAAQRATPEGKLLHEQVMYWDKLIRIRDFPKITIAAVQGTCTAAGLMLATMCDLIVAADDAQFSNPVLRMGGVGVELLIEPWELGARKAKEFLFCAETLDAEEAARAGLVNQVVPRDGLAIGHARDGRPRGAGTTDHCRRGQGHDQPHARHPGPARELALPLHGPPVREQHGGRARSHGSPA